VDALPARVDHQCIVDFVGYAGWVNVDRLGTTETMGAIFFWRMGY
jgi:hypothetical protein